MQQNEIINAYIDVDKITKDMIKVSEKTGRRYLYIDVNMRKAPTEHGEDVNVSLSMSKEEREAGKERVYFGNGRSRIIPQKGENPLEAKTATAKEMPDWTK